VRHAWNHIDRNFALSAFWCSTQMVAQQKLGLYAPTGGLGLILVIVVILLLLGRI
jgi:hypothetical protein